MYCRSNGGKLFRRYFGVSLAWWHTYKWCSKRIVQVFDADFFGPLFHHLFPRREFCSDKLKLPAVTTYLSYVRLAYPLFKEKLTTALGKPYLTERQRCLLQNLSDLCEYFIPVVCDFYNCVCNNILLLSVIWYIKFIYVYVCAFYVEFFLYVLTIMYKILILIFFLVWYIYSVGVHICC